MAEAAKQALHIAAHLDAIESRIGRLLNEGEHVLLDRFWWSIWVYGVVGGVSIDILEALVEAERVQWGSVQPSLIVLLDRDEPIERDGDINVWGRIRAEYLALASKERTRYPVEVVQNTGPAEQTASCVVDAEDQISTAVVGEHTHVAGEFGLAITVRKIKPHRPRLTIDALAGIGLLPGQLPLAKHWSAGRSLARQLRQAGAPPLRVISDGTLF